MHSHAHSVRDIYYVIDLCLELVVGVYFMADRRRFLISLETIHPFFFFLEKHDFLIMNIS